MIKTRTENALQCRMYLCQKAADTVAPGSLCESSSSKPLSMEGSAICSSAGFIVHWRVRQGTGSSVYSSRASVLASPGSVGYIGAWPAEGVSVKYALLCGQGDRSRPGCRCWLINDQLYITPLLHVRY